MEPKAPLERQDIIVLIIANSVPLIGVIFFGFSVDAIVIIYWAEMAFVTFFITLEFILNVIYRIFRRDAILSAIYRAFVFGFTGPFPVICLGIFIFSFLNFNAPLNDVLLPAALLFLSNGYYFLLRMLKKEYEAAIAVWEAAKPTVYLMSIGLGVVFCGLILQYFGAPAWATAILVVAKTCLDIMLRLP
jgi:hypothetical protein